MLIQHFWNYRMRKSVFCVFFYSIHFSCTVAKLLSFSKQMLREVVTDDSLYDDASWYRRHRGDPPLDIAINADEKKTARREPKESIWGVEYSECGGSCGGGDEESEGNGVFGSMFE